MAKEENGKEERLGEIELMIRIEQKLGELGAKLGDRPTRQDVLQATLDALDGAETTAVASSARRALCGKTYGTTREGLILTACKEYDRGGMAGRLTSRESFINCTLHDDGRARLSEKEVADLPRT